MTTLVVGHYPPAPGDAAAETVELVRRLVDQGDDVEVLSPAPSAAHHSAPLKGVRGALMLAFRARGSDRLVLQVSPGVHLRTDTNRVQWIADAGLLRLALRSAPDVTFVFDDLRWFPIGGRISRQLWAEADHVVVRSEEDAAKLQAEGGVAAERIEVQTRLRAARSAAVVHDRGWRTGDPDDPVDYAQIMDEIRSRAAADRRLAEAASTPQVADELPSGQSAAVITAKRAFRRAAGSYADPIIAAVKRQR